MADVKVRDISGNRGAHNVTGYVTKRASGKRKHGSVFHMDERDAKAQPGRYKVVLAKKVLAKKGVTKPSNFVARPTIAPKQKSSIPNCHMGVLGLTSVIIPSMGRPERLLNCIKGLYVTTLVHNVECIVIIDKDMDSVDIMDKWPVKIIFNDERKGAIACWNMGLVASRGEYVVFAADDLAWHDDWLTNALFHLQNDLDGYGMVGFNDTHYKDGFATHYLASRCFIKHVFGGRIAFPIFEFYGNDTIANDLAVIAGRRYWCKECMVKHEHYIHKERKMDALDRENNKKSKADELSHRRWLGRGAKIEWTSLI